VSLQVAKPAVSLAPLCCAALVLAALALPASAPADPQSIQSSGPTLDISPHDLDANSGPGTLLATGVGFGNGLDGSLRECTADLVDCTPSLATFTSGAAGSFSASVTVSPFIARNPGPGVVDCSHAYYTYCIVYAKTDNGLYRAGHSLFFYSLIFRPTLDDGTTGQRAAALKRCRKKNTHAKRKKCRRRARQLPI
jgi:hypothetical protein